MSNGVLFWAEMSAAFLGTIAFIFIREFLTHRKHLRKSYGKSPTFKEVIEFMKEDI